MAVNKVVTHVETRMQQLDELADKLANLDEDEDPEEIKQQYKEMS